MSNRKKIVAANWKMNLTLAQAIDLAREVKLAEAGFKCDVIFCPSHLFLTGVADVVKGTHIAVAAQDCSNKQSGAFTGQVSAAQLQSAGITHVIIGHSERREYNGESNQVLKEKLAQALKHNLRPIFCFGEPLNIRQQGTEQQYVLQQLLESLFGFTETEVGKMVLAYEPVWAIGTGQNATAQQAQQMHAFVRAQIEKQYSKELAAEIRILYGGSCKPNNAAELFACPDVDGGLIGGASLIAKDFLAIIDAAK